jgi:hypothetical protein
VIRIFFLLGQLQNIKKGFAILDVDQHHAIETKTENSKKEETYHF